MSAQRRFWQICFMFVLNLIVAAFCLSSAHAAMRRISPVQLKKPIYLGNHEALELKESLATSKFTEETFNVVFRCNKYKRTPSSAHRTVNCLAVAVVPDIDVQSIKSRKKR